MNTLKKNQNDEKLDTISHVDDKVVYEKMLENFETEEIMNLAKQVSEKFLDKDNDLYQFFHQDFNNKE